MSDKRNKEVIKSFTAFPSQIFWYKQYKMKYGHTKKTSIRNMAKSLTLFINTLNENGQWETRTHIHMPDKPYKHYYLNFFYLFIVE